MQNSKEFFSSVYIEPKLSSVGLSHWKTVWVNHKAVLHRGALSKINSFQLLVTPNAYGEKVVYSIVSKEGDGSDWLMSTHCNVLC